MCNFSRVEFEIVLSDDAQNKLLIIFSYSEGYKTFEEFVLVYLTKVGDKYVEVIKYDCSRREPLHVHRYYGRNLDKLFIDLPCSIDSLIELKDKLLLEWHKHLIKFQDGKFII